jgi:hypothetical protein
MDNFVIRRKKDNEMQNVSASANSNSNLSTGSAVESMKGTKNMLPSQIRLHLSYILGNRKCT